MTKNDAIKLLEQTNEKINDIEEKIRAEKKANKVAKIKALENEEKLQEKILNKKESFFKLCFFGITSCLASIISLMVGSISNPLNLGFFVGFGTIAALNGIGAYHCAKKKVKLEREVLLLKSKISILSANSFENLELNELIKQKENYITIIDALSKDDKRKKQEKEISKSIEILDAVKTGVNTNRYVDGNEYDASNETLLNYQKSLIKKDKEESSK